MNLLFSYNKYEEITMRDNSWHLKYLIRLWCWW